MSSDSKDWGYEAHNMNVESKEIRKKNYNAKSEVEIPMQTHYHNIEMSV